MMRIFSQTNQVYNNNRQGSNRDDVDVSAGISNGSEPTSIGQDYHSFPSEDTRSSNSGGQHDSNLDITASPKDYRGFNTSIADMYRYKDQERIDCCAIACCGCFQTDRDRYLMTGKKPPTCCRRFFVHVVMPLSIFGLAIFAAVNVPDPYTNQMLCYGFVFVFIFYLVSQCLKGAWKRRQVRRNLLYAKYHMRGHPGRIRQRGDDDSADDDDDEEDHYDDGEYYLMGQTRSDIRNAHALCGCYATDRPPKFAFDADEEITFCTRIFDCLTNAFCLKMCGMHFVCCGFCAVAQEGRQLEAMVRPEMLRIDYITMQPMMEYYPAIYEARHSEERPQTWWFNRLSSFSRWTVLNTVSCIVLLFLWSLLSTRFNHSFRPMNFLVFCLTLLQAFMLLALVYRKHTKDVSIDALIKFFAVGFCLSTTLGVFFELVLGLIVRVIMALLMAISGVDVVEEHGYSMTQPGFGNIWTSGAEVNYGGVEYRSYLETFGNDHPFIFTIYLMVTSFILAALVEEICKYFGYRMVDHPDFHTRTQVEEAMRYQEEDGIQRTITSFSDQNRTFQSRGAAITVSMVAVGLGFACCENLVYIFIYGKATLSTEVFILLARSLFPIHPIAAALQSIGVCMRDLENNPNIRLGKIIAPAVLFHGFYDFSVMWLNYMGTRTGNYVDEDDRISFSTAEGAEKISSIVSTLILISGMCYFTRESRKQRQRLANLDGESVAGESSLT